MMASQRLLAVIYFFKKSVVIALSSFLFSIKIKKHRDYFNLSLHPGQKLENSENSRKFGLNYHFPCLKVI